MSNTVVEILGITALAALAYLLRMIIFPDITLEGDVTGFAKMLGALLSPAFIQTILMPPSHEDANHFLIRIGEYASQIVAFNLIWVLLWYVIVSLFLGVDRWDGAVVARRLWWIMFLIAVVVSESPFVLVNIGEGGWLLLLSGALSTFLIFYLGSCVFSPTSHKYIAPLATLLRRWG